MAVIFRNANAFTREGIRKIDVLLENGILTTDFAQSSYNSAQNINLEGLFLFPGLADVHVHFREPGFSYKETIRTGSMAAAHGGYTAVCTMPNLNPVPSTLENLQKELDLIEKTSCIHVYPIGAITMEQKGRGELSHIEEIAPYVPAFSDDGKGIQDENLMREAMKRIKSAGKFITAHCEVESELKKGGCINEGEYAKSHGHVGINNASEYLEVQRDINIARELGAKFHVCHVSTKESVDSIREAKRQGLSTTAETAPHYLMFTDSDLQENGRWKMNPPIRSAQDRQALIAGIIDGTIDCIITDHAPHSQEEKSKGLDGSAFGIVGLETCFASMYHNLVLTKIISIEKLLEMMCVNPRKIFGLPGPQYIEDNCTADFVIMDLDKIYRVNTDNFYSMGKSTLFDGMEVQGETVSVYVGGTKIYDREKGFVKQCAR